MKITAPILAFLLGLVMTQTVLSAELSLKALRVVRSADLIQVDGNWLKNPERIKATLMVSEDTPSKSIFARAHFFDQDGNLLHTYKEPCDIWTETAKGLEAVGLPQKLERGRRNEVYFAITDELNDKKWRSVIVVFGNDSQAVATSRPPSALENLQYPEKDLVEKTAEK